MNKIYKPPSEKRKPEREADDDKENNSFLVNMQKLEI